LDLSNILLYHVVPGTVLSTDLTDGGTATTAQGSNVIISLANGPMVNDANILVPDVLASNGVIHIIDKVILPPANLPETEPPVNGTLAPTDGTVPPTIGTAPPTTDTAPPTNGTAPPTNGTLPTGPIDIVATAQAAGSFSTLLSLVNLAGLTETLQSPGPFTVFAPTGRTDNSCFLLQGIEPYLTISLNSLVHPKMMHLQPWMLKLLLT
jgi:transforming growth factor-beta-induced protein